jgi:hypothetical protein
LRRFTVSASARQPTPIRRYQDDIDIDGDSSSNLTVSSLPLASAFPSAFPCEWPAEVCVLYACGIIILFRGVTGSVNRHFSLIPRYRSGKFINCGGGVASLHRSHIIVAMYNHYPSSLSGPLTLAVLSSSTHHSHSHSPSCTQRPDPSRCSGWSVAPWRHVQQFVWSQMPEWVSVLWQVSHEGSHSRQRLSAV